MAPNKRKILEAARKYVQKGAKDKALKEYQTLLKLDPRDAKLRLEIGDAYRRWGQVEEAVETYQKVAEQYTREGFDARAVAVFKQILNLDPDRYAFYEPLAELYQRMGLVSEAIHALQTAAEGYQRTDRKREALDLLRKMTSIDPSDTTSRIKVADLLRQEGLKEEAIAEYQAAASELERQGELPGAGTLLERILEFEPNRPDTLASLAKNLHARGENARAEKLASHLLEAAPAEPAHYEILAEIYRSQNRGQELASVYRRLSDVYKQRGDEAKARDILQRFVPSEGFALDEQTSQPVYDDGLFGSSSSIGDGTFAQEGAPESPPLVEETVLASAPPTAEQTVLGSPPDPAEQTVLRAPALDVSPLEGGEELLGDDLLDDASLLGGDDGDPFDRNGLSADDLGDPAVTQARPREEKTPPPAYEPTGDPEQLLAEASVYLRYGKREQAIENLEAVLARDAGHRAALEKLGEAYAEGDDAGRAVEMWLRAAGRALEEDDRDGARLLRDRIASLDPEAASGVVVDEPAPRRDPPPRPDDASASGSEFQLDDIEIDLDADAIGGEPVDDLDLDVPEIDDADAAAEPPDASADDADTSLRARVDTSTHPDPDNLSSSTSQQIVEDLEEADFYLQQGLKGEAETIYQRVLSVAPNHPHALLRLGELAAARGDDPGSTASGIAPPSDPSELRAEPSPAVAADPDPGESGSEATETGSDDADDEFLDDFDDPQDESPLAAADETPVPGESDADDDVALAGVEAGLDADASEVAGADASELAEGDADGDTGDMEIPFDDEDALADEAVSLAGADGAESGRAAADPPEAAEEAWVAARGAAVEEEDPATAEEDAAAVPQSAAEPRRVEAESTREQPIPAGLDSFDLAKELSDALDPDPNASTGSGIEGDDEGFAAVFHAFKKGVRQTLSDQDHEAHYDLGIAYREMGLLDDALSEFRVAAASSERRVDSLHMSGLCALDLGRPADAREPLEQALATSDLSEEQRLPLHLGLARAFEALSDFERARAEYEAVAAIDPDFCDVGERLAALEELEKGAGAPAGEPEFEAFDDVFDELHETESDGESDPAGETFQDLFAEVDAEDEAAPATADEPAPVGGEATPAADGAAQPAERGAQPEEPDSRDPDDTGSKPARRRKKKISFV